MAIEIGYQKVEGGLMDRRKIVDGLSSSFPKAGIVVEGIRAEADYKIFAMDGGDGSAARQLDCSGAEGNGKFNGGCREKGEEIGEERG
jgi:hypothetical protein